MPRYFGESQNPIGTLSRVPGVAIVSRRITRDGRPLGFAIRDEDGWSLFAGDEPPEFSDDPANFSPASITSWLDRDPAFREVATAPPGWMFAVEEGPRRARRFVRVHREPPPESLELVTTGWEPFQQSLAGALEVLGAWADSFLIIEDLQTERYVQFHSNNGMLLSAESVGDDHLPEGRKLGATVTARLLEAGWLSPNDPRGPGSHNFFRDWYHPAPHARVAEFVAHTLRDLHQAEVTQLAIRSEFG